MSEKKTETKPATVTAAAPKAQKKSINNVTPEAWTYEEDLKVVKHVMQTFHKVPVHRRGNILRILAEALQQAANPLSPPRLTEVAEKAAVTGQRDLEVDAVSKVQGRPIGALGAEPAAIASNRNAEDGAGRRQ